jgi:N-acetylneuraminic acid mutarotase
MRSLFPTLLIPLLAVVSPAAEKKLTVPDLPQSISSFGACVSDGHLYVYGGHAGKTHTYSSETTLGQFRRVNLSDPAKWEDLPGGLHLQGLALVAHKGKVIRVGGMEPRNKPGEEANSHSTATVQAFDPKAGKWADLPPLPAPRSSHDAVVVGDTLIVAGGWNMKGKERPEWHTTFHTLDLSTPTAEWKTEPQPFVRRALTAAVHAGKVYVIGGLTKAGETEVDVNVFDPATGKWTDGPKVPGGGMNGFTPAAVAVGKHLYLNPADGVVYKLDGDKWAETAKVTTPRWVHRAVSLGEDKLLVIGGAAKGGSRADAEVLGVK